MGLRSHDQQVDAHTFPSDDVVLAARVRGLLREVRPRDAVKIASHIETRLRPAYPHLKASVRDDSAGFGDTVIYVFRDASGERPSAVESWIGDPATARVVTDTTGTYVQANDAAGRLFGRPVESIVGRTAGSFTRPDVRIENAETVWAALDQAPLLHSFAVVCRGDGSETRVEFVTLKDPDGTDRYVTYLRECQ